LVSALPMPSGHSRSVHDYGRRMLNTTEVIPLRHTVRRTFAVLLVAGGCAVLTATVFAGLRPFFWGAPEDFDPTLLYLTMLVVVGSILVLHVAATPPDESADAGWLLAVAIITGVPALLFTVAMLALPFLFALERGWMALSFAPLLPVVAGPALGVGISAGYLLRADATTRQRRAISVAVIFTSTAVVQLLLLVVTRNSSSIFGE
jgi:hypothetical protein